MDARRDETISRLAQALDVPAELLAIPAQRWNCLDESEWKGHALAALATVDAAVGRAWRTAAAEFINLLEYAAADVRYRRRIAASESVVAYLPQWFYDRLNEQERARLRVIGVDVKTSWDGEEPQTCAPCVQRGQCALHGCAREMLPGESCYTIPCPSF